MVSASTQMGGSRQFFALLASLTLCACGSNDGGGSPTYIQSGPSAYAYVASAGVDPGSSGAIYEYAIMGDSSVSPLPQASIGAGIDPAAVTVVQSHVYVVNVGDGTISQYKIGSDMTLTPMDPATVSNPGMHTFGVAPASATADATGSFLYVTNAVDNTVSQFSIGGDGQLSPLTPSSVATGVAPLSLALVLFGDGTSGYYVVNSGASGEAGAVSLYTSDESGTLTPVDSATVAAGTNPSAIAMNETSTTVLVASNCEGAQCAGSIRQFAVGVNGVLTDTGAEASTGSHYFALDMVVSQNGSNAYAYVLSNAMGVDTSSGALWQYELDNTGQLTAASPTVLQLGSVAVAQVLQDGSLYVLTANSVASATGAATGGYFNVYGLGEGGDATQIATTKLSTPYPSAMGMFFLLAP